jgi:hypothetical protein
MTFSPSRGGSSVRHHTWERPDRLGVVRHADQLEPLGPPVATCFRQLQAARAQAGVPVSYPAGRCLLIDGHARHHPSAGGRKPRFDSVSMDRMASRHHLHSPLPREDERAALRHRERGRHRLRCRSRSLSFGAFADEIVTDSRSGWQHKQRSVPTLDLDLHEEIAEQVWGEFGVEGERCSRVRLPNR